MTQDDVTTWAQDAQQLLAYADDGWEIERSSDNPLILVCTRTQGTSTHVIAGRPDRCLSRLRALPPVTKPAIVRADSGGWLSGPSL